MSKFIEEIEQELKEIASWPWKSYSGFIPPQIEMIRIEDKDSLQSIGFVFDCKKNGSHVCDATFLAKSPKRIAKLLELLKEAKAMAEFAIENAQGEFEKHKAKEFLEKLNG